MKKSTFVMMFLMLGLCSLVAADKAMGVFVNSNTNCIQFINPSSNSVSPNYLAGLMGSYGGGLFDVVITPDGKTAVVSNFGDSRIFFIDISNGINPPTALPVSVRTKMFAEDMVVTPNGKYVLVADGGFSPYVTTVLVDPPTYVFRNYLGANKYSNSVDITPDGQTVVVSDYFSRAIHTFALDNTTGILTHKKTVRIVFNPVNTAISPDGKTVITVTTGYSGTAILYFDNAGVVHFKENIPLPSRNGQSCVFNKAGDKAYYLSNSQTKGTLVHVLNVTGPGQVSASDTSIKISPRRGTSQLFGVDTIALDPNENFLYVTNPTLSGGIADVAVVDLSINQQVGYLPAMGIPTGITFTTIDDGDGDGE